PRHLPAQEPLRHLHRKGLCADLPRPGRPYLLPIRAPQISTLFPYTTLFRSKLVKDFLKVRCRLALLPFLISCLIWKRQKCQPATDRKSGSAGMPRPNSYAVCGLKKKKITDQNSDCSKSAWQHNSNRTQGPIV